jgi:hypothetical protein
VAASGRIGGAFLRVLVGLEGGDDSLEAVGDLLVHLCHPRLPAGLGRRDDLQGLLMLAAVPGEDSAVVMNNGQVREALACWHRLIRGSPQ